MKEKKSKPCGGRSPYQDFIEQHPGAAEKDVSVDVTRDWLPSREHRRALLDKIAAAVPLLTDHQKRVLGLISQGNSFEEVSSILKISKGAVQEIVAAIRKKVAAHTLTMGD